MKDVVEEAQAPPVRVASDTSVLIDWHNRPTDKEAELDALAMIFKSKAAEADRRRHFIPPVLPDYLNESVSAAVQVPAVHKMIIVQALELTPVG